jgi:hypothetical protein
LKQRPIPKVVGLIEAIDGLSERALVKGGHHSIGEYIRLSEHAGNRIVTNDYMGWQMCPDSETLQSEPISYITLMNRACTQQLPVPRIGVIDLAGGHGPVESCKWIEGWIVVIFNRSSARKHRLFTPVPVSPTRETVVKVYAVGPMMRATLPETR